MSEIEDTQILELLELARWAGNHPARINLGCEGSVAAMLPGSPVFSVSAALVPLATLELAQITPVDLTRARALVGPAEGPHRDTLTPESLAEIKADPEAQLPAVASLIYTHLFALPRVHFALHTHPIPVNQILCSPRARLFADRRNLPHEVLSTGQASLLVPFQQPGLPLARDIQRRLAHWRDRNPFFPKLLLLQNHGMIVFGETADEVRETTEATLKYAEIFVGAALLGGPDFLKPAAIQQIDETHTV